MTIDQVDVDISEDGIDVVFIGWTADDQSFIATVPLTSMLDKALVSEEQWRHAAPSLAEFRSMG